MLARMNSARLAAAAAISSLSLAACGGDGGESGSSTTGAVKPRTLTAAEYPVMREFIIIEGTELKELRPLCKVLDTGPGTTIVKAAREACDRVLAIVIDLEKGKEEVDDCGADRACFVAILRASERQLTAIYDAQVDFNNRVEAAVAPGKCRDALTQPDDVKDVQQTLRDYRKAVDAFEGGDDDALDKLDDSDDDDDVEDPTPCRPGAAA